ncbi:hypothetical protein MVEN_00903100 [Mycena venus]|uniref:Uncharacterized protein n=1 Tax=Mycena venus TaxID=2733690 RepID=A0A8H6YH83_9AGAR|nr:hypothetical protein MVEN_00903100 [Mycena venus]
MMSVLSPQWPSQPSTWNGHHSAASFSALAAPVIPPLHPLDSPFPSPSHDLSSFNALAGSPPQRSSPPQTSRHQSPVPRPSAFGGVPQRNTRSLDRDGLIHILNFFSNLIPGHFGNGPQIRLVIHGGAVMLLNPELAKLAATTAATDGRANQRSTTRDIDYIARSFSSEWAQRYGVYDANDRLKQCIFETALQFGLGGDWMNSDADVALPMATDPATGAAYDPIHAASIQTCDALTVYTSPNGLLKLVSVTPFWTVALKMVRYNPADREDICILLRSGTLSRQYHWTPTRLEHWLLGTCWAMGYAGYDHERIKEMRRRMIEVVAEANRWDPDAVMDDGRGGVVPLRPATTMYPGAAYGHGYGYMHQPPNFNPMYNYYRGADPRVGSPFQSPVHSPRAHTFPPASSPPPFLLGPTPTPPPPPPPKKKKKQTQTTAVTTWPNKWTDLAVEAPQQQQWDPESTEKWEQDVRQTAAKEKKHGRMTSWIPFLKNSKSQPALNASKKLSKRRQYYDSEDEDDSSSEDDSDSDDEDWRYHERLKWGTADHSQRRSHSHAPAGISYASSFQHSVADFMSNGMTPIAAPAVMASGPTAEQGQQPPPVLPGWNFPGAQVQSPQPWTYQYAHHRHPQERYRSPQPDMNQVSAGMNALGLYGV